MEHASPNIHVARMTEPGKDIDSRLPQWARRTHPLVRRELGMAWRTMLPEIDFLKQAFIIQAILIALTIPFPFLIELALPTVTAAIILLPFALVVYARLLMVVGSGGARAMTHELQNDTLNVLRSTPFSLRDIVLTKAAAAMWRQVEDLGLLMLGVAVLSTPILISHYGTMWTLKDYPIITRAAIILGLGVSLVRMLLEPFMMAMLGVAMGTALRSRSAATTATLAFAVFYFLCINLARLIHMEWPLRYVVDFVLPLALPLAIMGLSFWLTRRLIEQE